MAQYFLNDKDRDRLLAALDKLDSNSPPISNYEPEQNLRAPDTYIGILPCDETIPARSGDTPGVNKVCLYKMEGTARAGGAGSAAGIDYKLVPVRDGNDDQIRVEVYNIYTTDVTANDGYIHLDRTKWGRWINERPTGTNSLPSNTRPDVRPQACSGFCLWTWSEVSETWIPDTGNSGACGTPDTTTTVDPCAQGGGGNCECCPPISEYTNNSTTTTATPTTTTLDPDSYSCKCAYPTYCGSIDGEQTVTGCTTEVVDNSPDLSCTPTTTTVEPPTTTTCDCNTTTTVANCSGGCEWAAVPNHLGGLSYHWQMVSNSCATNCPCYPPEATPDCGLANVTTQCANVPAPDPPRPDTPCMGNCQFVWSDDASPAGWVLTNESCAGGSWNLNGVFDDCYCSYPSWTGSDCEVATVACSRPPSNTTSGDPCSPCYPPTTTTPGPTTTTTSTTTCDPCSICAYPTNGCTYVWSSECEQWQLVDDGCASCANSCPSVKARGEIKVWGTASGYRTKIPCSGGTSTTTTTVAPCDTGEASASCLWKYSCDCDPPTWVEVDIKCNQTECPCSFPDYESNRSTENLIQAGYSSYNASRNVRTTAPPACNQLYRNYCYSSNTTTTSTTTTTTTVQPSTTTTTTTTCDPTTTSTTTSTTTTTVCPTTTTSTTTSTTTTSCNPDPDCQQPSNYYYRCGGPGGDPEEHWDTCCCEGPCCIYATNPAPGCQFDDG